MWLRLKVRISRLSLHTKIVLALFFTGLIPVGGAVAVMASLLERPAIVDQSLAVAANYARDMVAAALHHQRQAIATIAADPELQAPDTPPAILRARLDQHRARHEGLAALAVIDADGAVVATSTGHQTRPWPLEDGYTRARRGETAFATVMPAPAGQLPALHAYAPLSGSDGRFWAVLAGEVHLTAVTAPVQRLRIGEGGYGLLLSDGDVLLFHPDVTRVGQRWTEENAPAVKGPVAANARPAPGVALATADGTQFAEVRSPLPASLMPGGWTVVARVPATEVYGQTDSVRLALWLVPLGLAVMMVAIAVLLSSALRRPLREAVAAARRIAAGDFSQRLLVGGADEVSELAGAFNTMALQLEAKIQELEASRRRIVAGQEAVRRQMAEQLHGPVQTRLLVVWHRLGEVERLLNTAPDQALAELQDIRTELDQLREEDVRGISHRLHPSIVSMGLLPALRSLRDRYERVFPVELEIDPEFEAVDDAHQLPEEVTLAAYRGVDEALSNVMKHATPTRVRVEARLERGRLLYITVQDDGKGFTPTEAGFGLGIRLMKDYLAALGGAFLVHSRRGGGTRVNIVIPVHNLPTQNDFQRANEAAERLPNEFKRAANAD